MGRMRQSRKLNHHETAPENFGVRSYFLFGSFTPKKFGKVLCVLNRKTSSALIDAAFRRDAPLGVITSRSGLSIMTA
jgi:hypothetical protein